MLFYPGWRGSRSLQQIQRIRTLTETSTSSKPNAAQGNEAEQSVAASDPGHELLEIMQEQHQSWSRLEHSLLMIGILLIFLSFAAELFLVKLAS
jgi:hypothetical protein